MSKAVEMVLDEYQFYLVSAILIIVMLLTSVQSAWAVPSMARQTGMQCASCHTVFPELTPFGRQFKLRGFSMYQPKADDAPILDKIPISLLLQISRTGTNKTGTQGATSSDFPRDKDIIAQAAGLYYGGKITENSGALVQYSYDGIERRWGMEMFDARYANSIAVGSAELGKEFVYGVTLNNNPTLSDIYNSTPTWGFPYAGSATLMPAANTLIDMTLASQVGGVGVYGMWADLLYAEAAIYRTANSGLFRFMGAGVPKDNVIKNYAPYWRLALQHEIDHQSFSVGTYGMVGKLYADRDDFNLGTDRFTDVALDGQYQYINGDHTFSTQGTWIHENQEWNASFPLGLTSNASTTLKTLKVNAHYYYKRQWGGGVEYFQTSGDNDDLRYNTGDAVMGSASGSPNSRGWITELNYLPLQNVKLAVRYTAYTQFNGASKNYDGFNRDANDNNSLFLLAWMLF